MVWKDLALSGNALSIIAALGGAFCYAAAAIYHNRHLSGLPTIAICAGSMFFAFLTLLPFAILMWPKTTPSTLAWQSAVALGFLCTSIAFSLYYYLIESAGAEKATTTMYLEPVFAMMWGSIFLNEQVNVEMVIGAAVIFLGTFLANNTFRSRRVSSH